MSQLTDRVTDRSEVGVPASKAKIVVRIVALVVLFASAPVYEAIHATAILAPAVWVHLRTGLWMLQTHSIPRSSLFSQYPAMSWSDSSWVFDVLLAAAYRLVGLRAIPIVLMLLKVAVAVSAFLLARAGKAPFWTAVVLSAVAQYVIAGLQPLPYAVSIVLFAVELMLLVRSRQNGEVRELFWLPALFFLWANLDIQFIHGLILLALFLAALAMEQVIRSMGKPWISESVRPVAPGRASAVAAISLVATLGTPYTIHLLPTARALYSPVSFQFFAEMSAMSFRRPQDFVLMLVVMAAFLSLGRRRSLDLFELIILLAGTVIAFRVQRDGWVALLPAIAIISDRLVRGEGSEESRKEIPVPRGPVGAAVAAVVSIAAVLSPGQKILMDKIDQNYPVKACDYIRENHLPFPLFNAYVWGSFITWYLPEYPVAVDNRSELYGDRILDAYFGIVGGKQLLESDATVSPNGTLLLERNSGMARAFNTLEVLKTKYKLVYSDDLASVYVRQQTVP